MVRDRVVLVGVELAGEGRGIGVGAHLVVEYPVAQRLDGANFRRGGGDPNAELAGTEFAEARIVGRAGQNPRSGHFGRGYVGGTSRRIWCPWTGKGAHREARRCPEAGI